MDVVTSAELLGDESEADLSDWHVANGDQVSQGQVIAQIETAKVVLDLEAPGAGRIELLVDPGTTFEVGTVIARIS